MRICFLLKVRPDKIEEYKAAHSNVWPEMLDSLRRSGWKNYSLFLRPDGLLVGYLETNNFDQARHEMKRYSVNDRWQVAMAPFFETFAEGSADDNMIPLTEVFHLE